jgi:lysophospholipase L1-like esterase
MNPAPEATGWKKALAASTLAALLLICLSLGANQNAEIPFSIGGDTLSFRLPTWASLWPKGEAELPALDASLLNAGQDGEPKGKMGDGSASDTLPSDTSALGRKHRILNPIDSVGQRPLDAFFRELARIDALNAQDSSLAPNQRRATRLDPVRIAHYGDSQIEGDRITHHIRSIFQRRFGGFGVGFVPVTDPASHVSLSRRETGAWRRYTVFQDKLRNGHYGLAGTSFRYITAIPARKDSTGTEIPAVYFNGASFQLYLAHYAPFSRLRLLMGDVSAKTLLAVGVNGAVQFRDSLPPSNHLIINDIPVTQTGSSIAVELAGPASPEIYGVLLDGAGGVAVDNYSLRGHSGDGLLRISNPLLSQELELTNTRLIIFQYGGNMIPYLTEKKMEWIEDVFYQLFLKYRRAAPQASILVVTPADMATKYKGEYQSYKIIHRLVEVQRKAALRAGCAFWDLYETMGGEGSILQWAKQKPELAAADFAHFSPAGQRIVGTLLSRAILNEYEVYLKRQKLAQAVN